MPFVNIQLLTGASVEQKAELAKVITNAFTEVLHSNPESVYVISMTCKRRICRKPAS